MYCKRLAHDKSYGMFPLDELLNLTQVVRLHDIAIE